MEKLLSKSKMQAALAALDEILPQDVTLIMGGGGAMILAHDFPLATSDIDAIPKGMEIHELDFYVKKVAIKLEIPGDWLNPYFSTFSHTVPEDFKDRLIEVFHGTHLKVNALGKQDMLVMKCFAHRTKDIPHSKQLIRQLKDTSFVEAHIESLIKRKFPGAQAALEFLDDLKDQLDEGP